MSSLQVSSVISVAQTVVFRVIVSLVVRAMSVVDDLLATDIAWHGRPLAASSGNDMVATLSDSLGLSEVADVEEYCTSGIWALHQ